MEELVFENKEHDTENLLEHPAEEEFDFNNVPHGDHSKGTKRKFLTKKQKKTRSKMVKASRRKNR